MREESGRGIDLRKEGERGEMGEGSDGRLESGRKMIISNG